MAPAGAGAAGGAAEAAEPDPGEPAAQVKGLHGIRGGGAGNWWCLRLGAGHCMLCCLRIVPCLLLQPPPPR